MLPNILTILRFIMIPIMAYLYVKDYKIASLSVFVLASLTDFCDGYLARKKNQITDFGKVMDPLADKLMVIAALACFYIKEKAIPLWLLIVMLVKETMMVVGGIILYKKNVVVFSKFYGKLATVLFVAGIVFTFLNEYLYPINLIVLYIATGVSLVSMVLYGINSFIIKPKKSA